MDSMSFDYDQYFSDETDDFGVVIGDFGEICEDIVRIAGAGSQFLCKDFDNDLPKDSPPATSFMASNQCFDKEIPSLFSEMEYLTEVSPDTDAVLCEPKSITIAVNPKEFSCKRQETMTPAKVNVDSLHLDQTSQRPDCGEEVATIPDKTTVQTVPDTHVACTFSDPADYQRIMNNYIQKGLRKLQASSYSKMKASCFAREKAKQHSTSLAEVTVTTSPIYCPSQWIDSPVESIHQTDTATDKRIPALPPVESASAVLSRAVTNIQVTAIGAVKQLPPCQTMRHSLLSRSSPAHHHGLRTTRAYRCQDCNVSYPSSELLRKHACIIAEQYQCHLCLREFKKRKTLDHHMKSHDKVFSTDDDLRK